MTFGRVLLCLEWLHSGFGALAQDVQKGDIQAQRADGMGIGGLGLEAYTAAERLELLLHVLLMRSLWQIDRLLPMYIIY